jgi:hypothetical protein
MTESTDTTADVPSPDPMAAYQDGVPPTGRALVLTTQDRPTLLVMAVAASLGFIASFFPAPDAPRVGQASAADVRAWVDANSTALHVAVTSILLLAVAIVVVAAGLAALSRRHLAASMLPEALLGAAVVVAVMLVLDVAASATSLILPGMVDTSLADVSDPVVVNWLAIGGYTHFLGDLQVAFVAVVMVSGSLAARALRLVNRWWCYLGTVVGICGAVGTLAITSTVPALYVFWFVGMFGFVISLLVVAVSCLLVLRRIRLAPEPVT